MRTPPPSAGDGTCYKRWNDDCASSFRLRDNTSAANPRALVKYLFNRLNPHQELAKNESNNFSQSDVWHVAKDA